MLTDLYTKTDFCMVVWGNCSKRRRHSN